MPHNCEAMTDTILRFPTLNVDDVNRGGLVIEIDLNLTANRVKISLPKRLAIWPGYPLGVS